MKPQADALRYADAEARGISAGQCFRPFSQYASNTALLYLPLYTIEQVWTIEYHRTLFMIPNLDSGEKEM